MATAPRMLDSKGRLTLGKELANQQVLIEQIGQTEYRVKLAMSIPLQEAWLYQNEEAKSAVFRGLADAAAGRFSDPPPSWEEDGKLLEELED
ncbi:MAG: hypothetical protein KF708_14585 [Pirellulales bacterium]|nr:hypothetical protein [Pirellulales bacterium]